MLSQTKQTLTDLRWYGVLQTLDTRLHEATGNNWGNIEFLSSLAADESLFREQQKIKRRLQMAKFRQEAHFEKIDYTIKRNLSRTQVKDLSALQFLREGGLKNALILGPTGVGKTFLATAIGNHACRQGFTTLFYGMHMLIEKILLSRSEGGFLRLRQKLILVDLLIIDDIGLKVLPPPITQDLYDILEERYQKKCTLMTSQIPLENWKEFIEDPVILEAILDRLINPCLKLELKGESYRKKKDLEESPKT